MHEWIHIDQLGYRPGDRKYCFVTNQGGSFEVATLTGQVVFTGELDHATNDTPSGELVFRGDFSALREDGTYVVRVPGLGQSASFSISRSVFHDLHLALQKCFYYQRCGMDLEPEFAGPWAHKACHLNHGLVHGEPARSLPSHGGWHDAGDYGKYVVPGAKAIADLLLAYEFYPNAFQTPLHIPESGNGIPDVLNEVRYELEWMLRMQDPVNGGVFHKLTTHRFPGLAVMPEEDDAPLVFSPISYTATGTFVASMAMAARVYEPVDHDFAATCLAAANRAWTWLCSHPETQFHNPPDVFTGEYGDRQCWDELYWASAEMFRTTGDNPYQEVFLNLLAEKGLPPASLGWANVAGYGTIAYLMTTAEAVDRNTQARLRARWLSEAEDLAERSRTDGYQVTLTVEDYIWGSTMVLCNQAMQLLIAYRLDSNPAFVDVAAQSLHYLAGCNPLNQCYVTGFGTKPLMHPHHRPSIGDGVEQPVPGMVSGGPNKGLQDAIAKAELGGRPPAKCFLDHQDSYSTLSLIHI